MRIHRIMMRLARGMAVLGGLTLMALVILTCISVLGRGINTFLHWDLIESAVPGLAQRLLDTGVGPILGDTELVQLGMAFSVLAFFPFCTITAGHATVDIFTANFPAGVNRVMQAVTDVVFAAVLILIAARLWVGMIGKMAASDTPMMVRWLGFEGDGFFNETSTLLQYPLWWGFAAAFVAAAVAAVIAVYVAAARIYEALTARRIVEGGGAEH